jgi:hypothetical protein
MRMTRHIGADGINHLDRRWTRGSIHPRRRGRDNRRHVLEGLVEPIGVALVDLGMLRDIIEAMIDDVPDIRLVPAADSSAQVAVVCSDEPESYEGCRELLERNPRTRVVAVARDGRRAYVHQLRPVRTEIVNLSPGALLGAIRGTTPYG